MQILDLAKREKFRVNLIEAYDQPWKRQLEGGIGGYWGLIDARQRAVNIRRASRSQLSILEMADGVRDGARPRSSWRAG